MGSASFEWPSRVVERNPRTLACGPVFKGIENRYYHLSKESLAQAHIIIIQLRSLVQWYLELYRSLIFTYVVLYVI